MSQIQFREYPFEAFGNDLGLVLVCLSDGRVMLDLTPLFVPTYEQCENGVTACLSHEGFWLMETPGEVMAYSYRMPYPYKQMPVLKNWLVQQKLHLDLLN